MIRFTILGEPASKANSRIPRIVTSKKTGKPYTMFIKSTKANHYEEDALLQIPSHAKQMLQGLVKITLRIYYASARPDLDESIVLDVLQAKIKDGQIIRKGVYLNDRQIFEKHVFKSIGDPNPRAEIEVELIDKELFVELPVEFQRPPAKAPELASKPF